MASHAIAVSVPGSRCPSQHPWPLPLPSVKYGLWTECLRSACGPRKAGEGGLRGGDLQKGGRAGPAASGVPRTLCGDLTGVASGSLPPIRPHACMLCLAERQETEEQPRKVRGPVDVKASQGLRACTQDGLSPHSPSWDSQSQSSRCCLRILLDAGLQAAFRAMRFGKYIQLVHHLNRAGGAPSSAGGSFLLTPSRRLGQGGVVTVTLMSRRVLNWR